MTPQTEKDFEQLRTVRERIEETRRRHELELADLLDEEERLKWAVLDADEFGTQTAMAGLYGVSRQRIGQMIKARHAERKSA